MLKSELNTNGRRCNFSSTIVRVTNISTLAEWHFEGILFLWPQQISTNKRPTKTPTKFPSNERFGWSVFFVASFAYSQTVCLFIESGCNYGLKMRINNRNYNNNNFQNYQDFPRIPYFSRFFCSNLCQKSFKLIECFILFRFKYKDWIFRKSNLLI